MRLSSQIIRNEIAPEIQSRRLWRRSMGRRHCHRQSHSRRIQSRSAHRANAGNVLLVMIVVIIFLVSTCGLTRYNQRRTGIPWWYAGGSSLGRLFGRLRRRRVLRWRRRWFFRRWRRFRRRRRQRRLVAASA